MPSPSKQRLTLFLDGTWNTEDDSTNVRNAYHCTKEGFLSEEKKIRQKRYYDRGVGTGVFDSFTGGGFGFGLEENVRQAYNWLIDNYNDEDEIYIFGFSRGAYTARSLVGLISSCGLLKRGAPLTVNQMWKAYGFISKYRGKIKEEDKSWWKGQLEKDKDLFRRINVLRSGKWPGGKTELDDINETEQLLLNWSRRVKITYLGIYDTVGAMGIHVLGIPGLTSRLDQTHNQYPSSIIQNCRHALAIDEHRTSFRLTPILHFVENDLDKDKIENVNEFDPIIKQRWFVGAHSNVGGGYSNNKLAMYPLKWILEGATVAETEKESPIENGLALDLDKVIHTSTDVSAISEIRDSYSEILGIIWPYLLREKRHFREIGRSDLVRSNYTLQPICEEIDDSVFDFAIKNEKYAPPNLKAYLNKYFSAKKEGVNITRTLTEDHKVKNKTNKQYVDPPNLLSASSKFSETDIEYLFASRNPKLEWPSNSLGYEKWNFPSFWQTLKHWLIPRAFLICWSAFAAIGVGFMLQLFLADSSFIKPSWLGILAALFVCIDWGEFKSTLTTVLRPKAIIPQVVWNILYWFRLFGILAFFVGFIGSIICCISWGMSDSISISGIAEFFVFIGLLFNLYKMPFLTAMTTIILLDIIGKYWLPDVKEKNKETFKLEENELKKIDSKGSKRIIWLALLVSVPVFVYSLFETWRYCIKPHINDRNFLDFWKQWSNNVTTNIIESQAGQLLLLQILLVVFGTMFLWVGKPMGKAGLGSIFQLQCKSSGSQITGLFNRWLKVLSRTWISTDIKTQRALAWPRLKEILLEALWRDILGFIPIYSIIFGVILYIGSNLKFCYIGGYECSHSLLGKPLWFWLVVLTALADFAENTIHLQYLKKYPTEKISTLLFSCGIVATLVKFIGFFSSSFLSIHLFFLLSIRTVTANNGGGWRWYIATIITYVLFIGLTVLVFRHVKNRLRKK